MDREQQVLFLSARTVLATDDEARLIAQIQAGIDWERLSTLARRHQVWPLLDLNFCRIKDRVAIPEEILTRFEQSARATFFDNGLMARDLRRILAAMQESGIDCVPFKGVILAEKVYGNLALRPAADLDILVRHSDLPAARTVLRSLGFAQEPHPDFGHLNHALHDPPYSRMVGERQVRLDLHWLLWAPHLFPLDIDVVWQRTVRSELAGLPIKLLSPEDRLLHLSIHRSRSAVRLRLICDIAELLRRHGATMDWDYVVATAHQGFARTALYCGLSSANQLLGAPLPPDVLPRLRVGRLKDRMLGALWGLKALFRPSPDDGEVPELSLAQRFVMLDGGRQIVRGLSYRAVRGAKYLSTKTLALADMFVRF